MRSLSSVLLACCVACTGNLREKVGDTADASTLTTIPPPMCAPATTPTDGTGDCTGGGKPGDDCMMCHHQGGGATPFTFAGTLYGDGLGGAPVANATITLQDSVGNIATALTHGQGNFFSTDGFVMYPARAFASLCPDVATMTGPVDMLTGANCNTSGCHNDGFRVHVP